MAYYINSAELNNGSLLNADSLNFTITGLYLGGVSTWSQLSSNEAIIVLGSNCMVENRSLSRIFIKLKTVSKDEFLDMMAHNISRIIGDR